MGSTVSSPSANLSINSSIGSAKGLILLDAKYKY